MKGKEHVCDGRFVTERRDRKDMTGQDVMQ